MDPSLDKVQARESFHRNGGLSPNKADIGELRRLLQDELKAKKDILKGLVAMKASSDRQRVEALVVKRYRELYE